MAALLGQGLGVVNSSGPGSSFCLPAFCIPQTLWELLETYKKAKYGYP